MCGGLHDAHPDRAHRRGAPRCPRLGLLGLLGLTATPYRNDKRSMLSLLPVYAFARTIPEMVQEGYLAQLSWKPVQLDLDLAKVATTQKTGELDYAETTLARQPAARGHHRAAHALARPVHADAGQGHAQG